ncbi:hypothetical protein MmiEs2_10910 [Methanimicrococcus stummii]|uniref:S-layer family duplication domain-containing protein n=1 Tax=Methanimicrococcus stummii TaxID=3028294 RepID=A0AA96VBJ5_9EURY|nr:S-layer protein domain-containing protein [Methanimicrococcus sp. Es2]WNY28878.1 hypothetical protein MmiEs2_10910 [Methanimicrococcus sp. Es2]
MQMKHLLVALVLLLALVGTAAAADEVEIRSTILRYNAEAYNGEYATLAPGTNDAWVIDATSWAGLYYDLDTNMSTEKIGIKKNGTNVVDIKYFTEVKAQEYDYTKSTDWAGTNRYAVIGFFAEPYVALSKIDTDTTLTNVSANKIAKLVIDSSDRYTLKTGATLELGEGYSLVVDQIDVDGNKAYIKFMKDGKELNSSIVTTDSSLGGDWFFDLKVLNNDKTQVLRVHVKSVFQGTQDSLVEIEGLWLIDYMNAFEVKSDDKYGKFEDASITSKNLTFYAKEVSISADSDVDLGRGIYLKSEKEFGDFTAGTPATADKDKFYLVKTYTDAGEYEIRSNVLSYNAQLTGAANDGLFNYTNFAAFFYDIDSNVFTEELILKTEADKKTVKETSGLVYTTEPKKIDYDYTKTTWTNAGDNAQYFVMGFFGEKYVPLNKIGNTPSDDTTLAKAEKMAKLVIDSGDKYVLKTGATLELGEGYNLVVDQIDVDGNKAYIKFMKDGKELNSSIVTTDGSDGGDWIFDLKVLNEDKTQVLRVHVKSVFQGTESSLVEIEGLWLVDYLNATEIKNDDKFGAMKFQSGGNTILKFVLDSEFTIDADMDKQIANNMYLKTADSEDADKKNLYFYVTQTIGEGDGPTPTPEPSEPATPTETPAPTPTEVKPTPTEEGPSGEDKEPGFFQKYMWHIIIAIVLIIIIAGAAYYFMVYKKQA